MDRCYITAPRCRALGLGVLGTTGIAVFVRCTAPEIGTLVQAPGPSFSRLLVQCCAVVAVVAAVMLWLAMCDVVASVLHSPARAARRRVGALRAALLAVCGLSVLATTLPAAAAGIDSTDRPVAAASLRGLPLPDRAEGAAAPATSPAGRRAQPGPRRVRVVAGDSLWAISAADLGPEATATEIAEHGRRLYLRNADAIGTDPDLIHPGLVLKLPRP